MRAFLIYILTFLKEKTMFPGSKVVFEAIFPTNRGYICVEKWSQIFVFGTRSARSESEEKDTFTFYSCLSLQFPIDWLEQNVWFFFVDQTDLQDPCDCIDCVNSLYIFSGVIKQLRLPY